MREGENAKRSNHTDISERGPSWMIRISLGGPVVRGALGTPIVSTYQEMLTLGAPSE